MKVEESVVINRGAEDVFAYVSDQTNVPLWQRGIVELHRTTDGPIGVGTRHAFVRKFMGRRMEANNEYTRFEPPGLVAFKVDSGLLGQASYLVEPVGAERVRLTAMVEMQTPGLLGVAAPLMAAVLRRDVKDNLTTLRDLLEAKAPDKVSQLK